MTRRSSVVAMVLAGAAAAATSRPALADDPTTEECVAANENAQTLRRNLALLSARERLRVCVADGCPAPVRQDCAERLIELEKAMPSIVFDARDRAGNDLVDVRVSVDGKPLAEKLDGKAYEIDPGAHQFVFEAAGQPPLSKQFVLREGDKNRRESLVLAVAPPPAPATPAPVAAPEPHAASGPTSRSGDAGLAIVGFAAAGVGAIAGAAAGLISLNKVSDVRGQCHGDACPPALASEASTATILGDVSTVAFLVGAAGLVTGLIALPRSRPAAARGTAPQVRFVLGAGAIGAAGDF
jgi:hypothetical protein